MDTATKYSRIEYERRFLVLHNSGWENFVEPYSKIFEDKYLQDSRLRLRILTDSDTNRRLIKLTKKFESNSPYFQIITTILLSSVEYQMLDIIKGNYLKKIRHYHNYRGQIFSVDVFENELNGLILCETESNSLEELMLAEFPAYAKREVTEDNFFTGGNLCRITQAELIDKFSTFK